MLDREQTERPGFYQQSEDIASTPFSGAAAMLTRCCLLLTLAGVLLVPSLHAPPSPACCPVGPIGKPVVNADQTVLIIWDAATKTEHFIRRASFKSQADDFGFLIPTPDRPELSESGN